MGRLIIMTLFVEKISDLHTKKDSITPTNAKRKLRGSALSYTSATRDTGKQKA